MTILVDWQIRKAIEEGEFGLTEYDEKLVNPASLDFRLGNKFGSVAHTNNEWRSAGPVVNPLNPNSFETVWEDSDYYVLRPNEFILATTLENFDFKGSDNYGIAGQVIGKSSLGRLQLGNSTGMAGWIDPGFSGIIVLELFNYGKTSILLAKGMKIGQLVLSKTAKPSYDYKVTGRYTNQEAKQGSKGIH